MDQNFLSWEYVKYSTLVMPSQDYLNLLDKMANLHKRKSAGYSTLNDPWANFRRSLNMNIPPSVGAVIRLEDKIARIENLIQFPEHDLVNESITDTLMDAAAYCLITICLLKEEDG